MNRNAITTERDRQDLGRHLPPGTIVHTYVQGRSTVRWTLRLTVIVSLCLLVWDVGLLIRTFGVDGTDVTAEADADTPLLRIAEDAGLNPEHGCRMGICRTCDVPLVSGRVRDLRTGELMDEPGRPVQICISGAAGDCHLDLTSSDRQKAPTR